MVSDNIEDWWGRTPSSPKEARSCKNQREDGQAGNDVPRRDVEALERDCTQVSAGSRPDRRTVRRNLKENVRDEEDHGDLPASTPTDRAATHDRVALAQAEAERRIGTVETGSGQIGTVDERHAVPAGSARASAASTHMNPSAGIRRMSILAIRLLGSSS